MKDLGREQKTGLAFFVDSLHQYSLMTISKDYMAAGTDHNFSLREKKETSSTVSENFECVVRIESTASSFDRADTKYA